MKKYKTNPRWKITCFCCHAPVTKHPEYYKDWSGVYCLECGEQRLAEYHESARDAVCEDEAWKPHDDAHKKWTMRGKKGSPPETPEETHQRETSEMRYGES